MLVVADVFAHGGNVTGPTVDQPVYYLFLGGVEQDIGGSIAGLPTASPQQFRRVLAEELALHHFIETKGGGPLPQIALVCAWGTAALDTFEQDDPSTGERTSVASNDCEMKRLLGIPKTRQRLMSAAEAENLNDALNSERFYILVAALDATALRQRQKKVLWRTRISIDARRTTLPESMGLMIASAGPFFGREESRPIFVDDALRRNVHVEVGEATVIERDGTPPKNR